MLRDSARYYTVSSAQERSQKFFRGLRNWALTNRAYETGLQTGVINELEFKNIQLVNNSYTLQDSYNEFSTLLLTGLLTKDFDTREWQKFARYLAVGMTDIVIKEKELEKKLLINLIMASSSHTKDIAHTDFWIRLEAITGID